MSMFEDLFDKLVASFSDWIQVVDPRSYWTLENAPRLLDENGNKGMVDEDAVSPHCVKCVVANRCWFKNEKGKKPERFDYSKYSSQVLEKLREINGLYHPNCHCKEVAIPNPTENSVKLVCNDGKFDDLFSRKDGLVSAWGYNDNEKEIFKNNFLPLVKKEYINGNYKIFKYDEYGIQLSIYVTIPGINEKAGKFYKRETGFMLFPNGEIRNTTIIGRKWK